MDLSENESEKLSGSPKSKYKHITYELRKQLIKAVEVDGLSIYRASRLLEIKNCTAKAIMRQFRRKGHIFRRRSEGRTPKQSHTLQGPEELQNEAEVEENEGQGMTASLPLQSRLPSFPLGQVYFIMGWPQQLLKLYMFP